MIRFAFHTKSAKYFIYGNERTTIHITCSKHFYYKYLYRKLPYRVRRNIRFRHSSAYISFKNDEHLVEYKEGTLDEHTQS